MSPLRSASCRRHRRSPAPPALRPSSSSTRPASRRTPRRTRTEVPASIRAMAAACPSPTSETAPQTARVAMRRVPDSVGARARMAHAPPSDPLVLEVERLTFGADALARSGGQVVFALFAAPGDRVEARVTARHRGYLRAEVDRVLAAGPDRVLPGYAAFGVCGGCQWQHVAPDAQRSAKAAVVAEQLARVAGIREAPVVPTRMAGTDWGYRGRITLVVEGRRLGYHRVRSHRLVEIADCPIAHPLLGQHLSAVRAWVAGLRSALTRVTLALAPDGVVLIGDTVGPPRPTDVDASAGFLARHATIRGAMLSDGESVHAVGDVTVVVPLEAGLVLEVPADVFTQVNPAANLLLVETVVSLAEVRAGTRVLDLYSGAGNFAFPLARRGAEVLGVERTPRAVAAADANATRLGLARARFQAHDVVAALRTLEPGSFDLVILDPPRAGARAAIPGILALRATRILYVSCDPATLARDLRELVAGGYRLARTVPIDVFPQTFHIETVSLLGLT